MLGIIAFVFFMFIILALAITLLVFSLQARLFDQPPEGTVWRAPAAAAAIAICWLIWSVWTFFSPGNTRPMQEPPIAHSSPAFKKIQILTLDDRLETFALIPGGNPTVPRYRNIDEANRPIPQVMKEVRVPREPDDTSCQVIFRHEKGAYQMQESFVNDSGRYVDDQGRVMELNTLGVILPSGLAGFILLLMMNLLHVLVWVSAFSLVLQFPFGISVVIGLGGALLTNFTVVPFLIRFAETAAKG